MLGRDIQTSQDLRGFLSLPCPQMQPDWLFLSSWNEFIAQPVVAPQKSMGLETDTTLGDLGFVDTYGVPGCCFTALGFKSSDSMEHAGICELSSLFALCYA